MKPLFPTIAALYAICYCINTAQSLVFVVSKGHPAKLSTKGTVNENPVLGNDGNTAGTYIAGVQCFHCDDADPLPWWMVDMQFTYTVYGARVWNRLDGSTYRFSQISVGEFQAGDSYSKTVASLLTFVFTMFYITSSGISSNPSVWTDFNASLFNLCMYYPGVPTVDLNPINFTCSSPITGRYLAVYKNITLSKYLHFCEIDILAISDKTQISFTGKKVEPSFSSTLSTQSFNSSIVFARSDVECIQLCASSISCAFILFKSAGHQCWLLDTYILPTSFQSILSGGAVFLVVT